MLVLFYLVLQPSISFVAFQTRVAHLCFCLVRIKMLLLTLIYIYIYIQTRRIFQTHGLQLVGAAP